MGLRSQRHAPAVLSLRRPGAHCIGGWVDPRAGLDGCGKSSPTGIRSPDRPSRSESQYRLSYRAHFKCCNVAVCLQITHNVYSQRCRIDPLLQPLITGQ